MHTLSVSQAQDLAQRLDEQRAELQHKNLKHAIAMIKDRVVALERELARCERLGTMVGTHQLTNIIAACHDGMTPNYGNTVIQLASALNSLVEEAQAADAGPYGANK